MELRVQGSLDRNSLELRVQGERFNATHFDWKSIPQVSVLLIIQSHSSLMHTRAGVAQVIQLHQLVSTCLLLHNLSVAAILCCSLVQAQTS